MQSDDFISYLVAYLTNTSTVQDWFGEAHKQKMFKIIWVRGGRARSEASEQRIKGFIIRKREG